MPNIKSAKKRVRTSETRNLRNRIIKSQMKTSIKKLNEAISEGDLTYAETMFKSTISMLDKAVLKGTIHKNVANRKKAQLSIVFNSAKAQA